MNFRTGIGYDAGRMYAADRHNEDYYALPNAVPAETRAELGALYVVADGMGGHAGGEVAAQAAANKLFEAYYADSSPDRAEALRSAIAAANLTVYQIGQGQGQERMGSTVAAAVIRGDELIVGNVGDSRVYLVRNGASSQMSQDHTWVAERVAADDLTGAEARAHPQRHVLTRSLGAGPDVSPFVGPSTQLAQGDRVLLCTDGLWELVSDAEIAQIAGTRSPQPAARALVVAANARGGHDNITVLVVPFGRATNSVMRSLTRLPKSTVFPYVAGGLGVLMVLTALVCMLSGIPGALFTQQATLPSPTAISRLVGQPSAAPTKTNVAPVMPTGTSAPDGPIATFTRMPILDTTASPSPASEVTKAAPRYCIVVLENYPDSVVHAFRNPNDPYTNKTIGPGALLDEAYLDQVAARRNGTEMVQVKYSGENWWILQDRLGILSEAQKCIPIQ